MTIFPVWGMCVLAFRPRRTCARAACACVSWPSFLVFCLSPLGFERFYPFFFLEARKDCGELWGRQGGGIGAADFTPPVMVSNGDVLRGAVSLVNRAYYDVIPWPMLIRARSRLVCCRRRADAHAPGVSSLGLGDGLMETFLHV